jgi:hypothetical protein
LNLIDYDVYSRFDVPELAIVVAASLATWIISKKQSIGLVTNGSDPLPADHIPIPLSPRSGRGHLLRLLETLARIQVAESVPLVDLLRQEICNLTWGTTLILITNRIDDDLFEGLFHARRSGINAMLFQCGFTPKYEEIKQKASSFNFPLYQVLNERDLNNWRQ